MNTTSPLPWIASGDIIASASHDFTKDPIGGTIADCASQEHAQFIVLAVNSHASLVSALEGLIAECELSRKYIVLSEDEGFKAYNDTAVALMAASAALEGVRS